MARRCVLRAVTSLCLMPLATGAAESAGLLAEWNFGEGSGKVARDASGHGRDARIHGAAWVRQGEGSALSLDGVDDYVEFRSSPSLGLDGPVTVEAWVRPTRKAEGLTILLGQDLHSYLVALYATDLCYWYIGSGANSVNARVKLHEWNHIAGTFDGKRMTLWLNGRQAASRESAVKTYSQREGFVMGTSNPRLPKFKGMLDKVRVYSRGLAAEEVIDHYVREAAAHGVVLPKRKAGAPKEESTRFFENHPNEIDVAERGGSVLLANRQVGLELLKSEAGFELSRLYGIATDQDYLTPVKTEEARDVFGIRMTLDPKIVRADRRGTKAQGLIADGAMERMAGDAFMVRPQPGKAVSWRCEKGDRQAVLHMAWKGLDVAENQGAMDVAVKVTLRAGDALSYWRISVRNRSQRYGIERVRFPNLSLAPIGRPEDDVFIYPKWRGGVCESPFGGPAGLGENYHTKGAYYPYYVNMQFYALYNRESHKGIYLGTFDPTPNMMHFRIANSPSEIAWSAGHFPPNITFSNEDYALPYDCVVGPFQGDWYDACQIYRNWAIKQTWCRKGPLAVRDDVPTWYKETPLVFYTQMADSAQGTHSQDENLAVAAAHFREWLEWAGVRLPIHWYAWHRFDPGLTTQNVPFGARRQINRPGTRWTGLPTTHGTFGNYPKVRALDNFSNVCAGLREAGGMVCPYVCLAIYDPGADENAPYAAEAKAYMSRDLYGSLLLYRNLGWYPCVHSEWWRKRLQETCVLLLEREHVGGFYLDVMHGMANAACYWTPHGHSAAGGSAMTKGMHGLAKRIRDAVKARDADVITTGENAAENMIDVTDCLFYQRSLRSENRAPLFAAVYQDYARRYGGGELSVDPGFEGRYRHVWAPDAFFIECASLFVEGAQVGRLRVRPRDMSLSFQKPAHQEMIDFLGRMVGYYKQETAKKFLVYGQLMRPGKISAPSPVPMLPYTSYEVPAGAKAMFPALMNGVFRSDDGELGIFIVNASTQEHHVEIKLDPARHGMPVGTIVHVNAVAPDGTHRQVLDAAKGIVPLRASLGVHGVAMFRLRAAARQ